ncbi:MAG: hypothetical protein GY701_32020 [Sulfitobacter sp.]|nr:hypothetical protein [Sulfitobacter sp.]
MSFDIYVQAFRNGGAGSGNAAAINAVLAAHVSKTGSHGFARLKTDDGSADLYGYDNLASGFMVNYVSGDLTWDLIVRAARASDLVILPVGCPACVTSEASYGHLPTDLSENAVLVSDGAGLRSLIEESA